MRPSLVAVLLVLSWRGPAAAQTATDLERAKESFKAGATAYAAGEYLAAIQALDAAYALTPLPAIAFSLAQAERRQYFVAHERGSLDRAIALYRRYLEQVPAGGRRADALDALAQLEPLAAMLAAQRRSPGGGERDDPEISGGLPTGSAAAPARPTRLMITAETPGAQIALDGGPPSESPLIREVDPGPHRVETHAPGFFPDQRELTAMAGELIPVAVSLRAQPSTVAVTAPAEADIYLDGAFASRGGDRIDLRVSSGAHRVSVAEKGHRVSIRALELGPGETQDLTVTLEPTRQRRVSRAFVAGGGVALGLGLVFSALALRAEDRAQAFLRAQAVGSVTSDDLRGYHAAVDDRDHYRVASAVSLGSALAFLLTGLALHELDHPDPRELNRGAEPPSPPDSSARASAPAHLWATPALFAGSFGAALRAEY